MTDLVPQAVSPDADLTQILNSLAPKVDARKAVEKASKPSNTVAVSTKAEKALEALSDLLKTVEVPSERRPATVEERAAMMRLASTAKDTVPAINAAVDNVKRAIFNHFDLILEDLWDEEKLATVPVDPKSGHYLVKQEVEVPEEGGKRFTRELQKSAPQVTAEALRQAWKDKLITRQDYMDATKHVDVPREVVPEQLADLLKRKPKLLTVVKDIMEPGKVTAKFWVRPPKTEDDD